MSSQNQNTQVVIVGAGPTGLSLAAQLIRYGIDFIILEKGQAITKLSKAVVVQARSLEIFDELGIANTALQRGRVTNAFSIFKNGKRRARINIAGLGQGITAYPFALSLEQSKTEQLLYEYVINNKRSVQWQCEFLRYEEAGTGVVAHYKNTSGEEHTISSSYLVSCEGAHSLVRHEMGAAFEGDTVPKLFYVADVTLSSPVINKDELFGFLIKKSFALFFPMEGEGHYRLIGILPDRTDDQFEFKDIEQEVKDKIAVPIEFKELRWFSTYKVHSRMSTLFMKGRCFLAGDSAHIHTPAGGQGMNTGIQDVYNLAWKLAFVIKGKLKPGLLESYATERMQNARHLLRTTDRMFDVMAGTTPLRDFFRSRIVPLIANIVVNNKFLSKGIFPLISQTGIAYPESQLTATSRLGKINAGDRMPWFKLSSGGTSYDAIKDPVFKLLYVGKETPPAFAKLNALPVEIKTVLLPEAPADLFGSTSGFFILLRPDNYILYLGKNVEAGLNVIRGFSTN